MLRFPDSSLLRNLLVEDRLQPALLDGFAQRLAALQGAAERATPVSGFGSPDCGEARPDYLACAMRLTTQPEVGARLMITHGLSGSRKSSVALQLLCAAGAVRVRSDVERKRLYGLDPPARSAALGLDIYGAQATLRTFERLRACARDALLAGYPVIVDAAFLRGAERRSFEALAAELRVPFTILDCRATPATLRRRVAERDAAGTDASEASLAILPLAERVLTENDWRNPMTGHVPDLEYNALFTRIVNVVPVPISLGPAPRAGCQLNAPARRCPARRTRGAGRDAAHLSPADGASDPTARPAIAGSRATTILRCHAICRGNYPVRHRHRSLHAEARDSCDADGRARSRCLRCGLLWRARR
jgi:predicted kinase